MEKNIEKSTTGEIKELRFTLRNDYAFKKVFGSSIKQEPLIDLLSLILGFPKEDFEEVKIENPFLENEFYDDKKGILDIKLTLKDGRKVNIEMQNRWEAGYIKRTLYYWSKRYLEDIKESQGYDTLNPFLDLTKIEEKHLGELEK